MSPENNSITVMTMNLRFGLAKDGDNRWEQRAPLVAEILNRYPADFIGFQEINHFQAEFLERHLPEHRHVGWHNKQISWWQSNMIFFHRSWQCKGSRHHFISETPEVQSKLEGSKWPRQCVIGRFCRDDRKNRKDCKDRELLVVNTHFDFDAQVQARSADLVASFIQKFPGSDGLPVIVTGDFNSNPGSPSYDNFLTHGFRAVFPEPDMTTFHEFQGNKTGKHIDWILYRGNLTVESRGVVRDDFSGKYPSDHYPVRSTLYWEPCTGETGETGNPSPSIPMTPV